ncbi:MAG: ATP-binding protein [Spirochaetota bacterium]|jgi:type II secretory pathway predicted ATPase ExeA
MNNTTIKTTNFLKAEKTIKEAVANNTIAAIIGPIGSGKTFINRKIVGAYQEQGSKYCVVDISPVTDNAKNITQIMSQLIEDIAGESPRRDTEARRRQLRRILGDSSRKIILTIDEAQDLHVATLRGLKKLHELGFGTRDRLFTIILFGKPMLKDKLYNEELRPRVKILQLQALTQKEVELFIDQKEFTDKALELFIKRSQRTPLHVVTAFSNLIIMKEELDKKKIDEELVNTYFSADYREILKAELSSKSFRDLAQSIHEVTGEKISSATLNMYVNGKYNGNNSKLDAIMERYVTTSQRAAL